MDLLFRRFFHRKWIKVTGRVLDSRIRTVYRTPSSMRSVSIPLHSYIVEFAAPNGEKATLEVKQTLDSVDLRIGSEAPLLVSPDGKKAKLDDDDPRISQEVAIKALKKAEEERFRRHLDSN